MSDENISVASLVKSLYENVTSKSQEQIGEESRNIIEVAKQKRRQNPRNVNKGFDMESNMPIEPFLVQSGNLFIPLFSNTGGMISRLSKKGKALAKRLMVKPTIQPEEPPTDDIVLPVQIENDQQIPVLTTGPEPAIPDDPKETQSTEPTTLQDQPSGPQPQSPPSGPQPQSPPTEPTAPIEGPPETYKEPRHVYQQWCHSMSEG